VVNPNAAPIEAPKEIVPEAAPHPGIATGVPGGVEGGIPGGVMGGVVGGLPEAPPPPPPPPTAPVRVGGNIKPPTKTRDVKPIYPPIAQSARVQGVVIIEATIGADGRVKEAKVLRGQPLLDQAALDAVKQWQFTPTLLNNVPVPVIMTVTVNFTLQ
jgi:protein TonB